MWRYEWKKVIRQPVWAAVFLVFIAWKITAVFTVESPTLSDRIIKEHYSDQAIDEIYGEITEEAERANLLANENRYKEYQEGILDIEEYRQWSESYPERLQTAIAYEEIVDRAEKLLPLAETRKDISFTENRVWNVIEKIESFNILPYILILLLIPLLTETNVSKMWKLLIPTSYGLPRVQRMQMWISLLIIGALLGIDCLVTYGIPIWYYDIHTSIAVQSVEWLQGIRYTWTVQDFLIAASGCKLLGCLLIVMMCKGISKCARNVMVAMGLSFLIWGGMHLLWTKGMSPVLLFTPARLFGGGA